MQHNAIIFIKGRLAALVLLLAFQLLLARVLPVREYAFYAVVFAVASVMQVVASFGIPRLISKFVSQDSTLSPVTVRRLILRLAALRVGATLLMLLLAIGVAQALGAMPALDGLGLAICAAFILGGLLQSDGDSVCQALRLQASSRFAVVGEAFARTSGLLVLSTAMPTVTAEAVLALSAVTSGLAAASMYLAALAASKRSSNVAAGQLPHLPGLVAVACAGLAGSLAWFATSPAVVRLIGSETLPLQAFAAFAFVQMLVVSVQRYTPGALLFPLIEPMTMRAHGSGADPAKAIVAVSLVLKLDLILVGAAIVGVSVAGSPLVALLSSGQYAGAAFAIPFLLVYVVLNSAYRALELMSLATGRHRGLATAVPLSAAFGLVCLTAAGQIGIWALLLVPIADSASRLILLVRNLPAASQAVLDRTKLAAVGAILLVWSIGASGVAALMDLAAPAQILAGVAASALFLIAVAGARPFRAAEMELLRKAGTARGRRVETVQAGGSAAA